MKNFGVSSLAAVALVLAAAHPLSAVHASTPEPTVQAALQGKNATDKVRLRVWGFEVYDAVLHTQPGFSADRFAEQRFGLELNYLRAFKGADIAERSMDEMRGVAEFTPEQAERWAEKLGGADLAKLWNTDWFNHGVRTQGPALVPSPYSPA